MGSPLSTKQIPAPDDHKPLDIFTQDGTTQVTFFFGFDQTALLPTHRPGIALLTSLIRKDRAHVEIYALADRKGSAKINHKVSKMRLDSVLNALQKDDIVAAKTVVARVIGQIKFLGEDVWSELHAQDPDIFLDEEKDANNRLVVAIVWPSFAQKDNAFGQIPMIKAARDIDEPSL